MFKNIAPRLLVAVNLFAILLPFQGKAAEMCSSVFTEVSTYNSQNQKIDWKDDKSFIEASQTQASYGQVETFHSEKWNTQIYHTNTGMPDSAGKPMLIDPNAKAVVIFFHGSGTMKSSGRNFIANMNVLANMGFASISFDMPFHASGPRDEKFNDANYFMEWVRSIVLEAKKSGKPVYLAGHSFGPDVALEYATRYPKDINGVIGLSPAGFTKELRHWYDNFTSKMNFGGDVQGNDAGGLWAGTMSSQFLWSNFKLKDPTVVNPNLRIRILSGDREEYAEAPLHPVTGLPNGRNTYDMSVPLQKIFKNGVITIEPGIGHYLFEAVDGNGFNVVMRELMLGMGYNPADMKSMIKEVQTANANNTTSVQLAKKYSQDALFRTWTDITYGPRKIVKIAQQGIDKFSQKVMDAYSMALKERETEIYQQILNVKTTHPDFYEKYKANVDKLNPKVVETTLFAPYLMYVLRGAE